MTENNNKNMQKQKFSRKLREENVETNWKISFSLEDLSVMHWTPSVSQWCKNYFLKMCKMFGYLKNKNSKFKKRMSEKKVEGIKKWTFH